MVKFSRAHGGSAHGGSLPLSYLKPLRHSGAKSEELVLQKTIVPRSSENNVVEQGDSQVKARLLEAFRDLPVFIAGVEVPRGVVVGGDHRSGAVLQRIGENFPGVHDS